MFNKRVFGVANYSSQENILEQQNVNVELSFSSTIVPVIFLRLK